VAILSTGDELLAPGVPPVEGRRYDSNGIVLAAAVVGAGGGPVPLGIAPDRPDALERRLHRAASTADLIITSAGVSHGDYDLVRGVLGRLGRIDFWQVRMRPGRPLAFGSLGDTPLIGLPGNPVAAAVGFEELVRPAIRKMLGAPNLFRPEVEATARGAAANRDERRCFFRARVERVGRDFVAVLNPRQGSGVLTALAWANALVVVPEDVPEVRDGDRVRVQLLDETALATPGP
jgi:molybdopterin molybdotransferase